MSNAIAKKDNVTQLQPAQMPVQMAQAMLEKGLNPEQVSQMLDVQQKWEANEARKAFYVARAEFSANAPKVIRDKVNKQYGSTYSTLENFVATIALPLSQHGLSARWDVSQDQGIRVTCILSHEMGHSEAVSIEGPPDTSGSKNALQQIKSTLTYLKLATLEAVTGIASEMGNVDDDGNGSAASYITEKQVITIRDWVENTDSDEKAFCEWLKVDSLEQIYSKDFNKALNALKQKGKAK